MEPQKNRRIDFNDPNLREFCGKKNRVSECFLNVLETLAITALLASLLTEGCEEKQVKESKPAHIQLRIFNLQKTL